MSGMNKDADCYMYLGCVLLDKTETTKDEFNGGEPYAWEVPEKYRKDVPSMKVGDAMTRILESYGSGKSPKDDVHLYVLKQLLQGNTSPKYDGRSYELRKDEKDGKTGISINDKFAFLEERIERYATYKEDVGNIFRIEISMRETGA